MFHHSGDNVHEGSREVTLEWIEAVEICFMQPRGSIFLMAVVIWWPCIKSTRREWGVCVCPLCQNHAICSATWWADALNYRLHKLSTTHTHVRTHKHTRTHKLVLLSLWGLDSYSHLFRIQAHVLTLTLRGTVICNLNHRFILNDKAVNPALAQ